jgi:hypothetical protein
MGALVTVLIGIRDDVRALVRIHREMQDLAKRQWDAWLRAHGTKCAFCDVEIKPE